MTRPVLFPIEFLNRHGTQFPAWSPEKSRQYTRQLTRSHYENFPVVNLLAPRDLRQDYCNVYAFCRWADDLGDEIGDPDESLALLTWWREGLRALGSGQEYHPVYVALRETVERHALPLSEFENLIRAFEQDQSVLRYDTYDRLLEYCQYSANPVGRLVLRLNGRCEESLLTMSDSICTALQLANHWQDVGRDWRIDRVYIPVDVMRQHDYSQEQLASDIARGEASPPFRALMRDLVERAEMLFRAGLPLAGHCQGRLGLEVGLFANGGRAILDKIRIQGFDTISARPVISAFDSIRIALWTAVRQAIPGGGART